LLVSYMIEQGVAYLTLCERGYPRRLAFQYLSEVQTEFMRAHGASLSTYSRPYACVSFEPRLSKMRRDYLDPQAPGNLKKLNQDLSEIHNIMQQNIQDVLQRGEKLDGTHNSSTDCASRVESRVQEQAASSSPAHRGRLCACVCVCSCSDGESLVVSAEREQALREARQVHQHARALQDIRTHRCRLSGRHLRALPPLLPMSSVAVALSLRRLTLLPVRHSQRLLIQHRLIELHTLESACGQSREKER
jgi:hypothetical protein